MKKGTKIKLEKLDTSEFALVEAADMATFPHGMALGKKSLPIGYTLEGYLIEDVETGKALLLQRTKRNEVVMDGLTVTSPIQAIEADLLYTINSIYRVTVLEAPL